MGRTDALATSGETTKLPATNSSSISNTSPTTTPIGAYCSMPERRDAKSTSSIMTTNRNNTATAPT
jgi:hypothetical protein